MSALESILSQNQKLQLYVSEDLLIQVKAPMESAWLDIMVGRADLSDRLLRCHLARPGLHVGDENTSDLMTIIELRDAKGQNVSSSAPYGTLTPNQIGLNPEHVHGLIPPQPEAMEEACAPEARTSRPAWVRADEVCFAISCEHKFFGHVSFSSKPRKTTRMACSDKVCLQATTLGDNAPESDLCAEACGVCCACLCCAAMVAAACLNAGPVPVRFNPGSRGTPVQVELEACGPWAGIFASNPTVPLSRHEGGQTSLELDVAGLSVDQKQALLALVIPHLVMRQLQLQVNQSGA